MEAISPVCVTFRVNELYLLDSFNPKKQTTDAEKTKLRFAIRSLELRSYTEVFAIRNALAKALGKTQDQVECYPYNSINSSPSKKKLLDTAIIVYEAAGVYEDTL